MNRNSPGLTRWSSVAFAMLSGIVVVSGCGVASSRPDPRLRLDLGLVTRARAALQEPDFPDFDLPPEDDRWEDWEEPQRGTWGEVVVGEFLAIVPGAVVPGLGHYYAGDRKTGGRLLRVGGLGLVLTGVGGGLVTGGYFLDQEDDIADGYAYGLYTAGGIVGAIGLTYYLTAWAFDMVDTPRAVLSGGRQPRRTPFVEALDLFD